MGTRTVALACASVLSAAHLVSAQVPSAESLTNLQTAVACASPPVTVHEPADAVRIVGSQDVVSRALFGTPEVLVLSAGTDHGIKVNDMYFVRRLFRGAETINDALPHTILTAGWVRIVSVNEKMALASPEHTCSDIHAGDFLEPFAAPVVMEGQLMPPLVQSELNFDAYSKVMYGDLERRSIGTNEFATIEHGFDREIRVGTRFAVYRDLRIQTGMLAAMYGDLKLDKNPLKRIGEAVAVSVGPSLTLVRVTSARDAIFAGDVMVPRSSDGVQVPPPAPPPRKPWYKRVLQVG